jgi:hypothetical protein
LRRRFLIAPLSVGVKVDKAIAAVKAREEALDRSGFSS